ncbi:MAG: hypothetical protein GY777_06205 [Candidatus Brocadiaceae bacterium]|nr:hypothetical protein [Candidatus Brocadiaceae bacterium]
MKHSDYRESGLSIERLGQVLAVNGYIKTIDEAQRLINEAQRFIVDKQVEESQADSCE